MAARRPPRDSRAGIATAITPGKVHYHGESTCAQLGCTMKAYYRQHGAARCGRHSDKTKRTILPRNPDKPARLKREYEVHCATVDEAMQANAAAGKVGEVVCCKMTMFQGQQPTFVRGFMNVYPNYKHENRYGGIGMKSLSPKSMGPVVHGQPDLPDSLNLENFHQFSKKFASETFAEFRASQVSAFSDPEPHRHKPEAKGQKGNKNIPEYWVWTRADGTVVHKTYIECRQFYCTFYERFALSLPDFARLQRLIRDGTNLRICGYDGYMPDQPIMDHYKDESRPFGHELVLFTMLTVPQDQWPWRLERDEEF